MPIKDIKFTNVGPFDEVSFEFDEQVNVFIGPNNCGKSTVLMVLGEVTVCPFGFPKKLLRTEEAVWEGQFLFGKDTQAFSGKLPLKAKYSYIPLLEGLGYTTFVPALRQSTDFRSEGPLTRPKKMRIRRLEPTYAFDLREKEAYELELQKEPELRKRRVLISTHHSLVKDEEVVQKIIELDYKAYRQNNPSIRKTSTALYPSLLKLRKDFLWSFGEWRRTTKGCFRNLKLPTANCP